jgi:hypothetical protein
VLGPSLRHSADDQFSLQHFHAAFKNKRAALLRGNIHDCGLAWWELFLYAQVGEDHFTGTVCRVRPKERELQRLAGFCFNLRRLEPDHADVYQH